MSEVSKQLEILRARERLALRFCHEAAVQQRNLETPEAAAAYDLIEAALAERCKLLGIPEELPAEFASYEAKAWDALAHNAPDPIAATAYRIYRRALVYETEGLHDCLAAGPELESLTSAKMEGIVRLRALAMEVLSRPEGSEDRETLRLAGFLNSPERLDAFLVEKYGEWISLLRASLAACRTGDQPRDALVTILENLLADLKDRPRSASEAAPAEDPGHDTGNSLARLGRSIAVANRVLDKVVSAADTEEVLLQAQSENIWCQSVLGLLRPHIMAAGGEGTSTD